MVREINKSLDLTPVPLAPDYVRGLVNLRGRILTVFDLGVRLGLGTRMIGPGTHNVILKHNPVGLLVDGIEDVVQVKANKIGPPPANVGGIARDFLDSVVELDDELLLVLSAPKLLEYKGLDEPYGNR